MQYIKSLIFNILFITWTLLVCLIFSPWLFLKPKKVALAGYIWGKGTLILLRYICNLKIIIKGKENIPEGGFIIASKHQSELETIIFHAIVAKPVYVLKKELAKIPIIGTYYRQMGMIIIDRSGQMNALKQLLKESDLALNEGRPVVIFPEGTRTKPGQQIKYHPGITALYKHSEFQIIPVAINTGVFWAKNSFLRKSGNFTIEFLPALKPGLSKDEFNHALQQAIETNSLKLLQEVT